MPESWRPTPHPGILHAYQGPYGVVSSAVIGLVYGAIFLATRRLWPLVLAHAATDLIAVVSMY